MSNHNEALDSEKRILLIFTETNFYPQDEKPFVNNDADAVLHTMQNNPQLFQRIMQVMLSGALCVQ